MVAFGSFSMISWWLNVSIKDHQQFFLLFNPITWCFCIYIFWKRNLAYLYPHRFSQITHLSFVYLTEAVLICRNSQAYLPCIYCLIKTGSEERNAILLDQRLWKLKTCQLLLAYCLLEGPWAIIFSLFFFFQVDTEVPLFLLSDTCPFFLWGCRALAPFYFLEMFIFLHSPCL